MKSVNVFYSPMSDALLEALVQEYHYTLQNTKLCMISQLVITGGDDFDSLRARQTALPHRESLFLIVYDLFYPPLEQKQAHASIAAVHGIFKQHSTDGNQKRFWWGSYGDTNLSRVSHMYLPDKMVYERLQQNKRLFDPENLFSTPFTIPSVPTPLSCPLEGCPVDKSAATANNNRSSSIDFPLTVFAVTAASIILLCIARVCMLNSKRNNLRGKSRKNEVARTTTVLTPEQLITAGADPDRPTLYKPV
jgi:hypothetical protein